MCCFGFISLFDDTAGTIPATRRLVFDFWVINSTTYEVQKNLLEKAFESMIEMGNLYSVVVEIIVAEANDFFKAFVLLLTAFKVLK